MKERMEYLKKKRAEVLEMIEPICKVHNIKKYDYQIRETGQTETLILDGTKIGCSSNSLSAIKEELIGYIFIFRYRRSLGHFETQTKNRIKRYWLEEDKPC